MKANQIQERLNRAHELAEEALKREEDRELILKRINEVQADASVVFQNAWDELKKEGSEHYKTGGVEPVDLYIAGGMFRDFALCSIIKYAFRNRAATERTINPNDLDKIIDYAQKLKAAIGAE